MKSNQMMDPDDRSPLPSTLDRRSTMQVRKCSRFYCPNTDQTVQAYTADDPDDDDLTYTQVNCLACAPTHFVKNGVLGFADE